MSGVVPRYETGPVTYEVAETVKGGLLVEARGSSLVGVAGAASIKVLGVAMQDGLTDASRSSTDALGYPVYNTVDIDKYIAVGVGYFKVKYAANASFGAKLIAAADGEVTPYVAHDVTASPSETTIEAAVAKVLAIVGYCAEPAGVTISADAYGLAKITV